MTPRERVVAAIHTLTVATVVVLAYLVGAYAGDLRDVQEEQEWRSDLRAHQFCEAENETRQVLATILDELAAPRDDDLAGEYEERLRLRERVDPYVALHDCPPAPEEP